MTQKRIGLVTLVFILIIEISCKKESTSSNSSTTSNTVVTKTAEFSCTFDGISYDYLEGKNNLKSYGMSLPTGDFASILMDTVKNVNRIDIRIGTMNPFFVSNSDSLKSFFKTGNRKYSKESGVSNIKGVTIKFIDNNSNTWYSYSGDQTYSSFHIDNSSVVKNSAGNNVANITATFNCYLYDGNGNSKMLTNGKFYGQF